MGSHTYLIAFGTFGNPNGFKQTFFGESDKELGTNNELAKKVKTFDLNTNAIRLFPNSKIYAIRKEYVAGYNAIAYSKYTFAKEQNSERSGTFIGSSVLYTDKIGEENITINQLDEYHSNLISKYVKNNVITVNHSDKLIVNKPKDFENIECNFRKIENLNFIANSGKSLVVYTSTAIEVLSELFRKSIDLLNVYDTIYFTGSEEVARFVRQKNIFKCIQNVSGKLDFDQEIQNLIEERKRKRDQSISDFEQEVRRLKEDRLSTIKDYQLQIDQSIKVHQENDLKINQSKKDLETIKKFYEEFTTKAHDLVNQLKSGKNLDDVKQLYNENKDRFIEGLNTLKRPDYISKLPKNKPKVPYKPENQTRKTEKRPRKQRNVIDESKYNKGFTFNMFKYISIVLFVLLILSWIFFVYKIADLQESEIQNRVVTVQTPPLQVEEKLTARSLQPLNPISNSELNENDFRLVAKKLNYNTRIEEVVKIIFNMNPSDIKSHYDGQDSIYSKHLFDLNKDCFENREGILYFSRDTLRHIPSYKKEP